MFYSVLRKEEQVRFILPDDGKMYILIGSPSDDLCLQVFENASLESHLPH